MEGKEYREGAKALLGLKKKEKREQGADTANEGDQDESDKSNVEAAVLKYVAGDLDGNSGNHGNNSTNSSNNNNHGNHNGNHNNKKSSKRKKSFNNEEINDFQHWNAFLDTDQLHEDEKSEISQSKTKKKRKQDVTVDPELAQLDDTTDHEQLVRAAILDANQLAQDANIQDYIQQPPDENDSKYSQLAHHALGNTIIQATQDREQGQDNDKGNDNDSKPIPGDAAELVAAAATKASNWVQTQQQGKMFSKREIEAIDRFIVDYCQINNMTRKEICQRVWANERRKDDFWDLLHKVLPYRTRASVYKHVRRAYHIFEVRGKWSPDEDLLLNKLVAEKQSQWKLIGSAMGRMPEDCRDRWRNYVKCGSNRASNKWSIEEEEQLKEIVSNIIKDQEDKKVQNPAVNWTVVSEEIGGTRSRIQCRYKWNKILKREALARAQTIDIHDRVWLLSKLQELRFLSEAEIDWEALAAVHPKTYWTGTDFKICYEKMRSNIRDHKKKNVVEICHILLQDLIQEANRNNIALDLPVVLQHFDRKHTETAVIASAAISSTGNNGEYVFGDDYK